MQNQQQSQNNNTIKNPKGLDLPQVKGPEMNDRDFINDGLSTCKYITDSFSSIKSDSLILKFNGVDKPMVIQGSNNKDFLYLVMPMNK